MAKSLTVEQRQKILLKAPNYFKYAANWLNASTFMTEGPRSNPVIFGSSNKWDGKCAFARDNEVFILRFRDAYHRISPEKAQRAFKYDFRKVGSQLEVFRFDTHGRFRDIGDPCHVHNGQGNDIRIEENDPVLNGYSMISLTLCDIAILIQNYLEQGVLPWAIS